MAERVEPMGRWYHKSAIGMFLHRAGGNSGVEFALVLPILTLMLFGAMELGRALHDYHVVDVTVRDAARYLGRAPYKCDSPGTGTCTTCNDTGECGVCDFDSVDSDGNGVNDYIQNAKALAMTGDTSGGANLLGGWTDPNSVTISMCTIDNTAGSFAGLYAGSEAIPHVKLRADVPFTFLFGELVVPNATIDFNIEHNVVMTGNDVGAGS